MVEDRSLSVDEIALYLGAKRDIENKGIDRKQMPAHKVWRLWKSGKKNLISGLGMMAAHRTRAAVVDLTGERVIRGFRRCGCSACPGQEEAGRG